MIPKFSFLILTYNSERFVKELLDSLLKDNLEKIEKGIYELLVIDNNSSDKTVEHIKKYFSDHKIKFDEKERNDANFFIFKSSENLGYAKGINKIAKFAKGELLLVINPDAQLVESEFEKIYDEFEKDDNLAIAGLKIVDFKGKPEKTAGKFFNLLSFLFFALGMENLINIRFSPDRKLNVDYVSGGFVVFKSSKFKELNGYDEDYFMYVEDMDICLRARNMGFKVNFLPYARIKHQGQGSSNKTFAIVNIYKGLQIFFQKHNSKANFLFVKLLLQTKALLIIFLGSVIGKKELVSTYKQAFKVTK